MEQRQQGSFFGQEDMSRLENLMERVEGGQPYGDQCDIDVLLEEIAKRLENRMVAKIDAILSRVQECTSASSTKTSRRTPGESSPPMRAIKKISTAKPSLEPNMDLLNHEAQDLVQDVVMSSIDVAIDGVTDDEGVIPDQQWRRVDVSSPPKSSQGSSSATKPRGPSRKTTMQSSSGRNTAAPSSSRPGGTPTPNKPRGVITTDNVDSTYTYVLRNSVRRSIPKYLQKDGSQSKAAVMHMFNDIRLAMADESLEDIIIDALRDEYLQGEENERIPEEQSAANDRNDSVKREKVVTKPTTVSFRGQQEADGGRQCFESRTCSNRDDEPHARSKPYGVRHVNAPASNARQDATDSYTKQDRLDAARDRKTAQDKSRQVSGGWTRQESDSSSEDIDKFYSALDVDKFYSPENVDQFCSPKHRRESATVKEARVVNMSTTPADSPKKQVQFAGGVKKSPSSLEDWKTTTQNMGDATMRHDSNLNYLVRRHVGRALPKYTYNKMVTRALTQLSEKLMDEVPLLPGSLSLNHDDVDFTNLDDKEVSKVSKGGKRRDDEEMPWVSRGNEKKDPWVSKGKNAANKGKTSDNMPWVSKGQNEKECDDLPWNTRGESAATSVTNDSSSDLPWVRRGNQDDSYTMQKRTTTPARELPSRMSIATQTSESLRALNDGHDFYPQTVTAGRGWNKNSNQSGDTLTLSSQALHEEIFYDALGCKQTDLQIISDHHKDEMSKSFLKRFRLNLLFRKQKKHQKDKKFRSAVHKVIEARRSGCIDDDGNFVQSIPPPSKNDGDKSPKNDVGDKSPKNDGDKSPAPAVKPKPKKTEKLDKNGNKRESKKRGSSRRRHNPDRESYPLPEEDDGSEGYASASEMDDFNPTAFLERNRRSAENRFYRDDGDDADVESDSDGANSSSRRVRFSDDVQHFGEILALQETESSDNLDAEDDEPDISRLSLKSKIELFEKVGSNEFLDERSYQGSPPPDLPDDTSTLPTKDRVRLFEDIHIGKKPTTCAESNRTKTPRRAVDSCQFTMTASKISFFEELSGVKKD